MAASVSCPSCKARVKVPDAPGKVVRCPECEEPIDLPETSGTTTRPGAVERLETVEDEDRARRKRSRDDDEDDDRPRPRKKRSRGGDEDDDYDDRPARRKRARAQPSGNPGLVIGLAAGALVLLLLVGCGIGAWLLARGSKDGKAGGGGLRAAVADNPEVNQVNFDKIQTDMALQAVEQILGGPGAECSNEDAKALIAPDGGDGGFGMNQLADVADNPQMYGLTGWYRWKNGPTTLLVGVDGANKVRVAGLVTRTANGHSTNWKSNFAPQGVGKPPPRPRPKR
jgi:hypothetical protein